MTDENIDQFDDAAKLHIFRQIHTTWIEPELERRRNSGVLTPDFRVYQCLVRLPYGQPAVVEFNDEVGFLAVPQWNEGVSVSAGDPIYLHQLRGIASVRPPDVDGVRVAFLFLYWTGRHYELMVDFSPNIYEGSPPENLPWSFSEELTRYLNGVLIERIVQTVGGAHDRLHGIGLWLAPALLPQPMAHILERLDAGDDRGARNILISHANAAFLGRLSSQWWGATEFDNRRALLEEALRAHELAMYHCSIHALIPSIEGIITDWQHANPQHIKTVRWKVDSKIRDLRPWLQADPTSDFVDARVGESFVDFAVNGPALQEFKQWAAAVDPAFPGRHPTSHGRYESALYNEENSIKAVLLLDTVHAVLYRRGLRGI